MLFEVVGSVIQTPEKWSKEMQDLAHLPSNR